MSTHGGRSQIVVLRAVHERLAELAKTLTDGDLGSMSQASEWSVAQVFSHLGSGAELGVRWLSAATQHVDAPSREEMQAVWDVWNARSPRDQVVKAVEVNGQHVAAFESLSDDELAAARIVLFGMLDVDGFGLAKLRLPEATVHTWDAEATVNADARLEPRAVPFLVDTIASNAWLAKPQAKTFTLSVSTSAPERAFTLVGGPDGAALHVDSAGPAPDGTFTATAEALVRLAYGRLHDQDTDGAQLDSATVTLDDLRATFPGI